MTEGTIRPTARRTSTHTLTSLSNTTTEVPGEHCEVRNLPHNTTPVTEWAEEPCGDTSVARRHSDADDWPPSQALSSIDGEVKVTNCIDHPGRLDKNEPFCQVAAIGPSTSEEPYACAQLSPTHSHEQPHPLSSDSDVDYDSIMSDDLTKEGVRDGMLLSCVGITSSGPRGSAVAVDPTPGLMASHHSHTNKSHGVSYLISRIRHERELTISQRPIEQSGFEIPHLTHAESTIRRDNMFQTVANSPFQPYLISDSECAPVHLPIHIDSVKQDTQPAPPHDRQAVEPPPEPDPPDELMHPPDQRQALHTTTDCCVVPNYIYMDNIGYSSRGLKSLNMVTSHFW